MADKTNIIRSREWNAAQGKYVYEFVSNTNDGGSSGEITWREVYEANWTEDWGGEWHQGDEIAEDKETRAAYTGDIFMDNTHYTISEAGWPVAWATDESGNSEPVCWIGTDDEIWGTWRYTYYSEVAGEWVAYEFPHNAYFRRTATNPFESDCNIYLQTQEQYDEGGATGEKLGKILYGTDNFPVIKVQNADGDEVSYTVFTEPTVPESGASYVLPTEEYDDVAVGSVLFYINDSDTTLNHKWLIFTGNTELGKSGWVVMA